MFLFCLSPLEGWRTCPRPLLLDSFLGGLLFLLWLNPTRSWVGCVCVWTFSREVKLVLCRGLWYYSELCGTLLGHLRHLRAHLLVLVALIQLYLIGLLWHLLLANKFPKGNVDPTRDVNKYLHIWCNKLNKGYLILEPSWSYAHFKTYVYGWWLEDLWQRHSTSTNCWDIHWPSCSQQPTGWWQWRSSTSLWRTRHCSRQRKVHGGQIRKHHCCWCDPLLSESSHSTWATRSCCLILGKRQSKRTISLWKQMKILQKWNLSLASLVLYYHSAWRNRDGFGWY